MSTITWPDYRCDNNGKRCRILRVQLGEISLVRLAEGHLETVRHWRNDPDVNRYLFTRDVISSARQRAWFEQVSSDPDQHHFVTCFRDAPIGACYLRVHPERRCAESSYYLAPGRYRHTAIAFLPALLLHDAGLHQLGLTAIEANVMRDNQAAIRFNHRLGYVECDTRDAICHMQLTRPEHRKAYASLHQLALRKRRIPASSATSPSNATTLNSANNETP